MVFPRIDSISAGRYVIVIVFICYLCTGVHTDDPPINCGRDRLYVNLFKVLVDDNSNIQSVIEELGVLGFEYKQQVVSNFHSFRLKEDFNESRCPINRNWIKEVHSDKILSIEQDFHRIIDPLDYAGRANDHAYISVKDHTTLPFTTSTSGSPRYHHMIQQGREATNSNVTVTVGVVDIGFDMSHPNLKDKINVPLSYDFLNEDPDPSPPINCPPFHWDNDPLFRLCSHGTMCMGIIGNSHITNSECNRGICDGIQLAGLKIMDNMRYPTDIQEARALESQPDKIDIISASYGKADNIGYMDVGQVSKEALRLSVKMGRKCKGRIFVFPSGNGGRSDNCNMDGYAKNVHSITVTNVGSDLKVPFHTEICPCTLAAAVLDINFKTAALDHACLGDFTSSSAAVPTAAGHIANMLKVNPTLTKRDVEHIIVLTALPIGFTGVQWKKNGAGLLYNNQLGFGILNPPLMLEKAKIWHHVPEQLICDCKAVQNTVDTTSCCDIRYLEHVEVELRMCCRNCYDNDLATVDIDVTSPSNTLSRVMTYSKIQADRGDAKKDRCRNWTFMTVNFWLEDPVGKWSVNWSARQIDIEVDTLKVVFYGTIADPRTTPGRLPECETAQPDVRKLPTETKKSNIALMVITVVVTVMGLLVLVCLYKCRRYLRRRRMRRVEEIQMRDGREL